jgi:acyl dehydratase
VAATFPDVRLGEREVASGRTLTEAEIVALNLLVGAAEPRRLNRRAAEAEGATERALAPSIILAILSAGWGASRLSADLATERGLRWIAAHGVHADFLRPFVVGDTLTAEYTPESVEAHPARPGRGILHVRVHGINQRGELVVDAILDALFDDPRAGA